MQRLFYKYCCILGWSIRVNSPLDTTGCENSTARTLEEKTRIYSRQSSTIVPGLVLPAQLTEGFYKYERWAMSNDDQMMMNQAHGLTPDDGHDEDLIAGGQEETMEEMYNFLGEISEQIQAFNATMQRSASSSQPPVVPDDKLWDTGLAWEREFDL